MEWVEALVKECEIKSQASVAREMGISPTTINLVIKGKYPADTSRIEELVRSKYMHETVSCPVLGEIKLGRCVEEQNKPFSGHNSIRLALFKACANCANNKKCKGN